MYCSKCGKKINEDSKFCNFCGYELSANSNTISENKSWYELTQENKDKLIKEFLKHYNKTSTKNYHKINVILLIIIIPLALIVFMRTYIGTTDGNFYLYATPLIICIGIYIINLMNITKENKDFNKWLKTKGIIK